MKFQLIAIFVLFSLVIGSGCTQSIVTTTVVAVDAKGLCISLCQASTQDLSNGPCLSENNPSWPVIDYVCDVAHSPRTSVDNDPVNQCPSFGMTAHHFVEVTPDCSFIRIV